MIITLTGMPGSGKSTVAKMLAKKLCYKYYSAGAMRRKMAADKGMTLEEFNKLGETNSFTDIEVDNFQTEIGKKEDNFVADGRVAYNFIPNSFKIFLDADLDERARRIIEEHRIGEMFKDLEDAKKTIIKRQESDAMRYKKYYDFELYKNVSFDLKIDTTNISAEQVVDIILAKVNSV